MAFSTLSFRDFLSKLSGCRLGAFKRAASEFGLDLEGYIQKIEANLKSCSDCKQWKDRGEYDPDKSRWDGLKYKCRECARIRSRKDAFSFKRPGFAPLPLPSNDKAAARQAVNKQVRKGTRPNPNDLHCVSCGHKGDDLRHEYHHHMGYEAEHVYDVLPLCSACHHKEHP